MANLRSTSGCTYTRDERCVSKLGRYHADVSNAALLCATVCYTHIALINAQCLSSLTFQVDAGAVTFEEMLRVIIQHERVRRIGHLRAHINPHYNAIYITYRHRSLATLSCLCGRVSDAFRLRIDSEHVERLHQAI
jgi:hypothetical protein